MRRHVAGCMVFFLFGVSGTALAMGPRPPANSTTPHADKAIADFSPEQVRTELGNTDSLFRSTLGAIRAYGDRYVAVQTETELAKAPLHEKEVEDARVKARAEIARLNEEADRQRQAIERKDEEIRETSVRIARMQTDGGDPQKFQNLQKEVNRLKGERSVMPNPDEAIKLIENFKDKNLESARTSLSKYKNDLEAKLSPEQRHQMRMDGVFEGAKDAFDRMKDNYYDAKLLLTDFKTIRSEGEIQMMKAALGTRLNDTLLGSYVNTQIKKAMMNICDLKKQCSETGLSEKATGDLKKSLEQILGEDKKGTSEAKPAY